MKTDLTDMGNQQTIPTAGQTDAGSAGEHPARDSRTKATNRRGDGRTPAVPFKTHNPRFRPFLCLKKLPAEGRNTHLTGKAICPISAEPIHARQNKQIQDKIGDLFEYRYLFVKHTLTQKEKSILQRITRGLDPLRSLRSIMDEVYRLFDRRCRMDTASEKLVKLRCRVRRFAKLENLLKKLESPNLEKALTFLDDSLLPATSNAVERANRRHRKMQKSIYRVRTREHISQRIAVDMQRDLSLVEQKITINTLHGERNSEKRKTG
jgi:hypothetical protein